LLDAPFHPWGKEVENVSQTTIFIAKIEYYRQRSISPTNFSLFCSVTGKLFPLGTNSRSVIWSGMYFPKKRHNANTNLASQLFGDTKSEVQIVGDSIAAKPAERVENLGIHLAQILQIQGTKIE
jgi:hypothetical protein